MHLLRCSRWLSCVLLVWFSAVVAAATAAPFVNPQTLQLVCSAAGEVKLLADRDDNAARQHHGFECPLCLQLHGGAPAERSSPERFVALPLSVALVPAQTVHIALRSAASLPARGPPPLG